MATKITISLDDREEKVLNIIANKLNINANIYAENIVKNFLKSQIMGRYKSEFQKKNIDELEQLFGVLV